MEYVRVTIRIGSDSGGLELKVPSFARNLSERYGGATILKGTGYWQDEQNRTDTEPSYTVVVVVPRDAVEDIKESVKRTFRGLQDCDSVMMEVQPVRVNFIQTT